MHNITPSLIFRVITLIVGTIFELDGLKHPEKKGISNAYLFSLSFSLTFLHITSITRLPLGNVSIAFG